MPVAHFQTIIYVEGTDVAVDTSRTSQKGPKTSRKRLRPAIVNVQNALCQCNKRAQSHKRRNCVALGKIVVPCSVYFRKQPA